MLFKYEATTLDGERQNGTIESANLEIAISSLQRKNLIIVSIDSVDNAGPFWQREIKAFNGIKMRDIVVLSRQLSTLFEAKVQILDSFKLLAAESESATMRKILSRIAEDIQGGMSMSQAMAKHPDAFSKFYVSMIMSGEESGRLEEVFVYLADYMERNYDLTSKAKGALYYPAFVISSFLGVMILMMTVVVPKLTAIIVESGQEIPFQTKVLIAISNFLRNFWIVFLLLIAGGIIALWKYIRTETGKNFIARFQLMVPYVGDMFKKVYITRICDNLNTLLSSGISVVRALEITTEVVGNRVYEGILREATEAVKAGNSIADVFAKYEDFPPLLSQMVRIGQESGKMNFILATLAKFYKREVNNLVDNLLTLIEPLMIIMLGLGVGILLVSILGPIYNITSGVG